ncbi:hypothetical protein L0668_04315 [Paraglaciecola aquimarina]|uniref:Uncharacterized protein n=1 Tax=Paraglaciecola algarum TaxID=3050085 RepID=A0ABS9D3J4_9ALTE|nr:hypothetical protein [Paraglaciecola sp. G1-23]MCF2947320.1 hypothetical protein [Paraglaciecola sp. G1-23]
MFYQSSLLVLLLMPVMTYLAGALAFSAFQSIRKKPAPAGYANSIRYRNGL